MPGNMYNYTNPDWTYRPPNATWMPNGYSGTSYPQYQQWATQRMQPMMPFDNIIRVSGMEGAKEFKMGPNSRAILMDAHNPIFYFKVTDDAGYPTIEDYDFFKRQKPAESQPAIETPAVEYATKEDLDTMAKQLAKINETLKELM